MKPRTVNIATAVVLSLLVSSLPDGMAETKTAAPHVPKAQWPFPIGAAQRPGTYLWSPGSAWTPADIDWNLERLHEAGFGFVHVIPIYGARGAEQQDIPFLSRRWLEMFDHIVRRAEGLGMFVDMTTGTGWCFGGPNLPPDAIDGTARYDARNDTVAVIPGMKVKRPAPGGEGSMINPFSPRAMENYLQRFSVAFDTFKPATPRAQYHDSFEYKSDWSVEFLDEFNARRGYDLRDHLGLFFGKAAADRDTLARLKADYRQTLSELHRETIERWTGWAHSRGMLTRDQAHGSPANLLDVYATSDIPETEMFGAPEFPIPGFRRDPAMVRAGDSDPRICMMAASAAHVAHPAGRQLVASESCTWMREHWHGSLAQMKLEIDLFFLAGVNQMLFHGSCYSPQNAPWPGWFFYASTQVNWRNSVWRDMPFLTDYIGRCQSVLQAGQPANDVLVYWPVHDLWMNPDGMAIRLTVHHPDWLAKERIGSTANALLAGGFAFDFISDRMLESLHVDGGRLSATGGSYRAIVVPAAKYIPETTLRILADLREQGATVIFESSIPADVPGYGNLAARRAELAHARGRLEQSGTIVARDAVTGLNRAGVPRESMVDHGLRFIRRKIGDAHWYFMANHTSRDFAGWVTPSSRFRSATLFDPMTASFGRLADRVEGNARQVYVQLAAGQTAIVCVAPDGSSAPAWPYAAASGEAVALTGQWGIEFTNGGPDIPAPYKLAKLDTWTNAPDARAQAFAGTARYTLRFPTPQGKTDDWRLDLGDVRESARVRLNGRDVGTVISLPYRINVGSFLNDTSRENILEIEVTSLSANRIRDLELRKVDWKVMKNVNIVDVNYGEFHPGKWPLEDSGLLGPVVLTPLRHVSP